MGIHKINETIKDRIGRPFIALAKQMGYELNEYIFHTNCPLDSFRGYKIAFDASNILYAKMTTAHNDIIRHSVSVIQDYDRDLLVKMSMKGVLGFFALVFKAGITPVVVFDGKLHPYKESEIKKRSNTKKAKQEKVDIATQEYLNLNPLEVTVEQEEAFRKELRNNIKILKTDYKLMRSMLEELGIFCIEAEYDGEQLCSRLNREGIVQGVYSTDTDNYAHGCSLLITEIYHGGQNTTVCNYFRLDELIIAISQYMNRQVTLGEIIDLCIMHGCDYNERTVVPKDKFNAMYPEYKSCGGVGALDCITKFGNFENFPQHYWPCFTPLNIMWCREIFYYQETTIKRDNIDTNLDWIKFMSNRQRIFQQYGFDGYLNRYFMSAHMGSFKIKSNNLTSNTEISSISSYQDMYDQIDSSNLLPHVFSNQASCLADSF